MRKLIVSTLMTLDGVVEDPGGFSDFNLGGWSNTYFDEEAQQLAPSRMPNVIRSPKRALPRDAEDQQRCRRGIVY